MLLLLPPSEGKTPAPDDGDPVDLATLSDAGALADHRHAVLDALAAVSARADAHDVLGVGASLTAEVARNTRLRSEPAAPAAHIYTGVLYAAAGLGELVGSQDAHSSRTDCVRIFSGLWGAVSPTDRIPAYRLSMGVTLPGIGKLATTWRGPLAAALDARATGDVVIDCRSATYTAAWKPPADAEWITVRVVRDARGKRTVVSHNAKHTRGVLAGHLLRRTAAPPSSSAALLAAAGALAGTVIGTEAGTGLNYTLLDATLVPPRTRTAPRTLELLIS